VRRSPNLLFVPASGARGSGEYYRSLAIARAAHHRWPESTIRFVLNSDAGYAASCPFETVLVQGTPTYNTEAVRAAITQNKPDIAIFDSAGRVGQLAHARRRGVATVYVSSRFKTRWKGFRLRRMRWLDQHWLAWPRLIDGELSGWERFKLKLLGRPEIVFLDPVHEPTEPGRRAALRREFGIADTRYVLFCAGGGGYERQGVPSPEIFARAAIEVMGRTSLKCVWVKGPNYTGTTYDNSGLVVLGALGSHQLIDLLADAELAVINGGSLLLQSLALRVPAVAAPIAGDQPARIAACVRERVAVGAELDAQSLASAAAAVLLDTQRLQQLRQRLAEANFGNGADQAVDALTRLWERS